MQHFCLLQKMFLDSMENVCVADVWGGDEYIVFSTYAIANSVNNSWTWPSQCRATSQYWRQKPKARRIDIVFTIFAYSHNRARYFKIDLYLHPYKMSFSVICTQKILLNWIGKLNPHAAEIYCSEIKSHYIGTCFWVCKIGICSIHQKA